MATKKELQNQLTQANISFKQKDNIATLIKLLEESTKMTDTNEAVETEVNPLEAIVLDILGTMKEAGEKYKVITVVKHFNKEYDNDDIYDFVENEGNRLAMEAGLVESADQRKVRIEAENKAKATLEAAITDVIEGVEELPTDSEEFTTLLSDAVESTGATSAKVRAMFKKAYEAAKVEMPKATRKTGGGSHKDEFGGKFKQMADFVSANPEATREQIEAFYENKVRTSKAGPGGYVTFAMQLRTFAKQYALAQGWVEVESDEQEAA